MIIYELSDNFRFYRKSVFDAKSNDVITFNDFVSFNIGQAKVSSPTLPKFAFSGLLPVSRALPVRFNFIYIIFNQFFLDSSMLPYSCINCDVSEKWRHQLLGSWRRSLLQILKPLLDEKSDKSSYDKISSKVEHIQSLQVFMKEIEKLRFSTDRKSLKQAVTDEILQKKNFSRFYLKDFLHNLMRII